MKVYIKQKFTELIESIIEKVLIKNMKELLSHSSAFTSYKIFDESEKHLADCDMYLKPSPGDIILSDGIKYPSLVNDIEVVKVKLSTTGLTGFIVCKVLR